MVQRKKSKSKRISKSKKRKYKPRVKKPKLSLPVMEETDRTTNAWIPLGHFFTESKKSDDGFTDDWKEQLQFMDKMYGKNASNIIGISSRSYKRYLKGGRPSYQYRKSYATINGKEVSKTQKISIIGRISRAYSNAKSISVNKMYVKDINGQFVETIDIKESINSVINMLMDYATSRSLNSYFNKLDEQISMQLYLDIEVLRDGAGVYRKDIFGEMKKVKEFKTLRRAITEFFESGRLRARMLKYPEDYMFYRLGIRVYQRV